MLEISKVNRNITKMNQIDKFNQIQNPIPSQTDEYELIYIYNNINYNIITTHEIHANYKMIGKIL